MHSTLALLARSFTRHSRSLRVAQLQRLNLVPRTVLKRQILPVVGKGERVGRRGGGPTTSAVPSPTLQSSLHLQQSITSFTSTQDGQVECTETADTSKDLERSGGMEGKGGGNIPNENESTTTPALETTSQPQPQPQTESPPQPPIGPHFLYYPTITPTDLSSFLTINLEDYAPLDPSSKHPTWGPKTPTTISPPPPTFTTREYHLLRRLTSAIAYANKRPTTVFVKELLRWILPSQQTCPTIFTHLTPFAWEVLFRQERGRIPTTYTATVGELAETHSATPLTEEQVIDYIGGLYWGRDRQKAIKRWTVLMASQSPPPSVKAWKLGVKLFALSREPARAFRVYQLMIQTLGYPDPKALIPVILAWNHLYQPYKAWHIYHKCRMVMKRLEADAAGSEIREEERKKVGFSESNYSDIALSFLEANSSQYSIRVLRHMHHDGFNPPEYTASAVKIFQDQAWNIEVMQSTCAELVGHLPASILNKYFYANWIKNLVRLKRPDLAMHVWDVMDQKGVKPDAQHLNGIIRGFLRIGDVRLAEELAELMITRRMWNLVSWRKGIEEKEYRKVVQKVGGVKVDTESFPSSSAATSKEDTPPPPQDISEGDGVGVGCDDDSLSSQLKNKHRLSPQAAANRQTISLMVLHYARARNVAKVQHYIAVMLSCEIPAASYTMNHLLNMYLRRSDMVRLAETFDNLIDNLHAVPDHETWHIMWFAMWKRYTQPKRRIRGEWIGGYVERFPTPRELFTRMARLVPKTGVGVGGVSGKGGGSGENVKDPRWSYDPRALEICTLVVRCFCFARDWEGLIVAMNAALRLWGLKIDQGIFKEVALGLRKGGMMGIGRKYGVSGLGGGVPGGNGFGRMPVTKKVLREAIRELEGVKRALSVRRKVFRLVPDQTKVGMEWERVKEKIRVVPSEEAEAALEAVTRVVLREIGADGGVGRAVGGGGIVGDGDGGGGGGGGGNGLMRVTNVDVSALAVERLRRVREEMGVQNVGVLGILPPAISSGGGVIRHCFM